MVKFYQHLYQTKHAVNFEKKDQVESNHFGQSIPSANQYILLINNVYITKNFNPRL
jgi:hypothetical protein